MQVKPLYICLCVPVNFSGILLVRKKETAYPLHYSKMSEVNEINSAPASVVHTPRTMASPPVSCPPSQYHSPSLSRSRLLPVENGGAAPPPSKTPKTPRTPRISLTPIFLTPLGSPVRKVLRLTKLDPEDAWLPITESRSGNKYYAAFHVLCSGIGVQSLVLPVAFTTLGWTWGMITLTLGFIWQLYTLWLLIQLHESVETGIRHNRYLQLSCATFGDKVGKLLTMFPIIYLSYGTCTTLIIIGGSTMKTLFQIACGATCSTKSLTTVEWYLVFTCAAVLLSQLPNLNSIAGVSLVGAITAVSYCTLLWTLSVANGRLPGVSYGPLPMSGTHRVFSVLNALGIVAFAFRGHNLVLEIQATMPSSEKNPSHVPMWKGVKVAYTLIAACLFPLAMGGYWVYGQMIPPNGMLTALSLYHSHDVSRFVLGLTTSFIIVNAVSSFQIYGMPAFDFTEASYTSRKKKPCPWWLRSVFRALFGFSCFFLAVAVPFLGSLAGLVGGLALPVTLVYPCFMWLKSKKPKKYDTTWWINWFLGISGVCLSVMSIAAGLYLIIDTGVKISFFNPQ